MKPSTQSASTFVTVAATLWFATASGAATLRSYEAPKPAATPPMGVLVHHSLDAAPPKAEERAHLARQLIAELTKLGPLNRARAEQIAAALPFCAYVFGYPEATEIECTWCEDGSLLAEWMLTDRRVGFSFETDEARSSWFLASRPPSAVDGSGYLARANLGDILKRALARG